VASHEWTYSLILGTVHTADFEGCNICLIPSFPQPSKRARFRSFFVFHKNSPPGSANRREASTLSVLAAFLFPNFFPLLLKVLQGFLYTSKSLRQDKLCALSTGLFNYLSFLPLSPDQVPVSPQAPEVKLDPICAAQ